MDFLDQLFGTPDKAQAMGLLGAHMMAGKTADGFVAAQGLLSGADDRRLKRGLLEAQVEETKAQTAERLVKAKQAEELQALMGTLFGPAGVSAPQVSPGAFAPSADGMGPTMPQSMAGQAAPGSRLAGLGIDQLAALKMRGLDLTKLHEYANTPRKYEGGSFYENPVTGKREFIPKVGEGMGPDGRGGFTDMPGYAGGAANIAGAQTEAQERAKSQFDLVRVYNPATQREEMVPRSAVLKGAGAPPQQIQPQPQPLRTQPPVPQGSGLPPAQPGVTGRFIGDPAQTMAAIMGIKDPQERANAMAAFQEQAKRTGGFAEGGGFPAGPSSSEAAAAAGAKVGAEQGARLGAERENELTKRGTKATDMLEMLTRAETLLKHGDPTESGIGALADKTSAFFGRTSKSAQSASALENIAAGLTMNVPRMEGPQGVIDVELYKTNAGMVGDRTKPTAERLAALAEVRRLQSKYAGQGDAPTAAQTFQQLPPAGQYKGKVAVNPSTGQRMRSNGLSWVEEK
jgi:hypothetical protein